jgi:hypothetical protein
VDASIAEDGSLPIPEHLRISRRSRVETSRWSEKSRGLGDGCSMHPASRSRRSSGVPPRESSVGGLRARFPTGQRPMLNECLVDEPAIADLKPKAGAADDANRDHHGNRESRESRESRDRETKKSNGETTERRRRAAAEAKKRLTGRIDTLKSLPSPRRTR